MAPVRKTTRQAMGLNITTMRVAYRLIPVILQDVRATSPIKALLC